MREPTGPKLGARTSFPEHWKQDPAATGLGAAAQELIRRMQEQGLPVVESLEEQIERQRVSWTQKSEAECAKIRSTLIALLRNPEIRGEYTDRQLDQLLNISDAEIVGGHRWRFDPEEQMSYEGTPYAYIAQALELLNLQAGDRLYDLGSGLGRVALFAAATSAADCRGIELHPDRVIASVRAAHMNRLNATFLNANVARQPEQWADGTAFFLFNPFSREVLPTVIERLDALAAQRPIRVASIGGATGPISARARALTITGYSATDAQEYQGITLFTSRS